MKCLFVLPVVLAMFGARAWSAEEPYEGSTTPSENQPAGSPPRLFQEVKVSHKSVARVQAIESRFDLRYVVLSSLATDQDDDGALTIRQKIETARLLQADQIARPVFTELLQKLPGTTFTLNFNADRDLTRFEGAKDKVQAAAGPGVGQTLMLASLVDRDGWKELDQLSFFRPQKSVRPGTRWERSMTHSWGFLGSWTGQARYAYAGKQGDLQRFPYTLKLAYLPPNAPAQNLPFQIVNPAFRHQEAGGTIYYDAAQRRVSRAEERFHVRGQMGITVLGQTVPVELDEDQGFQVRLLDYDPRPK